MKVSLRPLKGNSFEVEVSLEEKVAEVKKRIAGLRPEFPADVQRLIHAGKILADDSLISQCGIQEGALIVVMASKVKAPTAAPAAPAAATAPASAVAPAAGSAPTPSTDTIGPAAPTGAPTAPTAPASTPATVAPPAGSGLGEPNESTVSQLCEMGFPKDQVVACLRAAFNNADRAVEYLMTGIPDNVRSRSRSPRREHGGHNDHGHAGHDHEGGHGEHCDHGGHDGHGHDHGQGDDGHDHGNGHGHGHADATSAGDITGGTLSVPAALEQLRSHPRFEELRGVVVQNPSLLPQMLQALAQTHPALVQAITHNSEAFMEMLQEGEEAFDEQDGHEGDNDGATVQISESDRGAVQRLTQLGFSEEQALEAYLACDRKEELAANYLFDSMGG